MKVPYPTYVLRMSLVSLCRSSITNALFICTLNNTDGELSESDPLVLFYVKGNKRQVHDRELCEPRYVPFMHCFYCFSRVVHDVTKSDFSLNRVTLRLLLYNERSLETKDMNMRTHENEHQH